METAKFYRSTYDSAKVLCGEDRGKFHECLGVVLEYVFEGKTYEGNDPIIISTFLNAKPLADAYEKHATAGGQKGKTGGEKVSKKVSKKVSSKKNKRYPSIEEEEEVEVEVEVDVDVEDKEEISSDEEIDNSSSIASNATSNSKSDDAVAASRKSKLDDVKTADSIIDLYNRRIAETGCRLRSCVAKSEKRRGMVLARLREHGEENVRTVIEKAVASHFLNYGTRNGEPMDMEWVFGRDNFPKVLEGKYDNKDRASPPSPPPERALYKSPYDDISAEDWDAMGPERRLDIIHERNEML